MLVFRLKLTNQIMPFFSYADAPHRLSVSHADSSFNSSFEILPRCIGILTNLKSLPRDFVVLRYPRTPVLRTTGVQINRFSIIAIFEKSILILLVYCHQYFNIDIVARLVHTKAFLSLKSMSEGAVSDIHT